MILSLLVFMGSLAHGQAVIESSPYARATTARGFQLQTGAVIENDGQENLVINPGFERVSYGWEATGGSFQYQTSSGLFSQGIRGGSWDPTLAGQILRSQSAPMSYGLVSVPGVAYCNTKTLASDTVLEAYNFTDSAVLASATITPSSVFTAQKLTFTYPATVKNVQIRLRSQSNSVTVYVDKCFMGEPTPIETSSFSGAAVPDTNNAYDLGSSVAKWRDLWIGRNANIAGTLTVPSMGLGVVHSSSGGVFSSSLVVDADVSGSAAISRAKLASGTPNSVAVNDNSGVLSSSLSLPVTLGGTGLTSIGANGTTLVSNGTSYVSTPLTTSNVPEGSNLYFSDARVRAALSATSPLSFNSGTGSFSLPQSSASQSGYLSAADFTAFAAKANPGSYITSLTGEATASGPGAASVTLSNSAVVGKVLTGLNTGVGGSVTAADTILSGFGKLQNQTTINNAKVSGFPDPMTTDGDIIIRSGGVTTRLGIGAPSQVLTSYLGQPAWRNNPAGFTNPMTTTGDIIYSSDNSGTGARRAIGSTGDILTVSGGVPVWAPLTAANQSLSNLTSPTAVNQTLLPGVTNSIDLGSGTNQWRALYLGTGATFSFLGTGVVKSSSTGVLSSSLLANADVSASAAIDRAKLASGTANHVLINNGSGVMASEAQLAASRGGTGINSSATFPASGTVATVPAAGVVKSNGTALTSGPVSLTTEVSGVLPTANGGTGVNTSAATDGQLLIGATGSGLALSNLTGTTNQVNVANGPNSITLSLPQNIHSAATPTFGGLTLGAFSGNVIATGGVLSASNGTANQLFGTNAAGTAPEYKTLSVGTAGTDFAVTNAANSVVLNLPDASATARGVVTTGAQTLAGVKTFNGAIQAVTGVNYTRRNESSGATVNALDTTSPYVKVTSTVTTINGAVAATDGREIILQNGTASPITINHESGSATSANRFTLPNATALSLGANQSVKFIYDGAATRWFTVGGSGSGAGRLVTGTLGAPSAIVAGTGVQISTEIRDIDIYVAGSGGFVDITANPQISAGNTDGQRMTIIGTSDTNSVLFETGNGLRLVQPRELGAGNVLSLRWNGTVWSEVSWSN